jgi:hypothetical protein
LTIDVSSTDRVPHLLRHFVASGADVFEFTPRQMSLEEVFVRTIGEDRGF